MNLGTIWTVLFKEPGRYNWLLQYYLRAEGVTLSWVGTGRCLCSMDFTGDDYAALQGKLFDAASRMKTDGWWLTLDEHPERDSQMRKRLMKEVIGSLVRLPKPLETFYAAVMQRKHDDHHASHNNRANQALHLLSSSVFVFCYVRIFSDLTTAMCWGWPLSSCGSSAMRRSSAPAMTRKNCCWDTPPATRPSLSLATC